MSSLSWCIVVSLWGGWWEGSRLASSGGPADVNVKLERAMQGQWLQKPAQRAGRDSQAQLHPPGRSESPAAGEEGGIQAALVALLIVRCAAKVARAGM
jgi:hypothetical protein